VVCSYDQACSQNCMPEYKLIQKKKKRTSSSSAMVIWMLQWQGKELVGLPCLAVASALHVSPKNRGPLCFQKTLHSSPQIARPNKGPFKIQREWQKTEAAHTKWIAQDSEDSSTAQYANTTTIALAPEITRSLQSRCQGMVCSGLGHMWSRTCAPHVT
jgi:hypothetical protein